MATSQYLFNETQRKRIKRRYAYEVITENGTVSAAVMVIAAIAAVICANTDVYEPIHQFLSEPIGIASVISRLPCPLSCS